MKLAMLKVYAALRQAGLAGRMILQVHDELVLECPQGELQKTASLVRSEMENAFQLDVPLLTDARFGKNWGEMETIPR